MEDIVKLLEPYIKDATAVFSAQKYLILSCLVSLLKDLRDKLAFKADDSNVLKTTKVEMIKVIDDRYQDPNMQLLINKAAFLFKKFPYLSSSCMPATLDGVSFSLKEKIKALLY